MTSGLPRLSQAGDDVISIVIKRTLARADGAPPTYYDQEENLPRYEPASGPGQSPAVPPDQKLMDVISDTLSSSEGKTKLREAIDDLGDSAFSIEVCFTNVVRGLAEACAARSVTQDQRASILRFQEEWDRYRKTYIDLLWRSRVVAGHARTAAKDFANDFVDFLKDERPSFEDKKKEIQSYRKQLEEDIKNSQNLAQGFLDLQTDIQGFQGKFTDWLKGLNKIEHDIAKLIEDIRMTSETIQSLTTQMFLGAAASVALGGISASVFAIGVLCPLLWIGAVYAASSAVDSGMGVVEHIKKLQERSALLEKQKAKLDEHKAALSGMQTVHTILDPLQSDMELIRNKLGVFSKIWHLISADLVEIEDKMKYATTSEGKFLFKKRLQSVEKLYSALADALYQYETRVHTQPGFAVYK